MSILYRSEKNPILKPNKRESWEAEAVFNGCPIKSNGKYYMVYRALSLPHYYLSAKTKMRVSTVGIAESDNGVDFTNRRRLITPEEDWEKYGCEDPRITKIDGKYYIFYTALSEYPFTAEGIKVALAISKDLKTIDEKHLITPFNAKAMALFPEKINGKLCAIVSVDTDNPPSKIAFAYFDKEEDMWSREYWEEWYENIDKYKIELQRRPQDHVEVGAQPIKTEHGWLLIYCYIRDYFSDKKLFGIEAVLLDLDDPTKMKERTKYPILSPEEGYETYGMVPDTIFPSGAMIKDDKIYIYYGATDTFCALATGELSLLMEALFEPEISIEQFKRVKNNPILEPIKENPWEAKAVFNPAAIYEEGKVRIIYRAMSEDNTSVFGYAESSDGINIDFRAEQPIYVPREQFEQKYIPNGNSGCEDPRITKIDDRIYMLYTAYSGHQPPRIAITSIALEDFLKQNWDWKTPVVISPPEFDNKDACLLPEKVNGRYLIFHRYGKDIDIDFVDSLDFDGSKWLEEHRWLRPRHGMWDSSKIGIAAPPIKTDEGWLLLYHGVSVEDKNYRVGAVLLDSENPLKILGRTYEPLFEPREPYEKHGQVGNVVFPCGAIMKGDDLIIYYGGGDSVVGAAVASVKEVIKETLKY